MTQTTGRNRVPKGVSTGGRFTAEQKPETELKLAAADVPVARCNRCDRGLTRYEPGRGPRREIVHAVLVPVQPVTSH